MTLIDTIPQQVIRHNKGPEGWTRATMGPIDGRHWDATDRQWIQWLQDHGQDVVTIGDTMYQIVTPRE